MGQDDFPLFPSMGQRGSQVCTAIRFYLTIIDDLPFEQTRILSAHLQECEDCAAKFRLFQQTTSLVSSLPKSSPSAHIDEAILAAAQSWDNEPHAFTSAQSQPESRAMTHPFPSKKSKWPWLGALVAAVMLLALAGMSLRGLVFPENNTSTFQLPANLSWSGYVLHYTQTRTDTQGKNYQIEVYQDLGTHQMHIESTMPDQFDVVVVTDASTVLGKDMMHHVAQMGSGVESWAVDGSLFDLAHLRQDLATQRATYLGKGRFQGQEVYQVQINNNQVLLLNMRYLPVAVLRDFTGSGTGISLYNTYELTPSAQVSETMWDMQIPPNFHMGELPSRS
jgi:hypothetical protein